MAIEGPVIATQPSPPQDHRKRAAWVRAWVYTHPHAQSQPGFAEDHGYGLSGHRSAVAIPLHSPVPWINILDHISKS
jgi:hypothetical protein